LREFAQKAGLSLSERGLLDHSGVEHLCAAEEEVYEKLGLPWIPPEMREDRGEIQAAAQHRLPNLIRSKDLIADLHLHTDWSDGKGSIEEMIFAAKKIGRRLLAITDHSYLMKIGEGLRLENLERQRAAIEKLRSQLGHGFTLLHGAEVDILSDGSLDLPTKALQQLDIVVASLHFGFNQPRQVITDRLLKAIRNPFVDIIAHPSGRSLPDFEGADLDWEAVFSAARQYNVALEINANPAHLDLDEIHARKAAEQGVLLCINSDSHAPHELEREFGVAMARRAWIEPQQVLNTWSEDQILAWLKNHKQNKFRKT